MWKTRTSAQLIYVLLLTQGCCLSHPLRSRDTPEDGAAANPPLRVVVTFKDYVMLGPHASMDSADYYVDGVEMGRGDDGFERVMAGLRKLPSGSVVVMWFEDFEHLGANYVRPYANHRGKLMTLADQCDLRICEPKGPWTIGAPVRNPRYFTY